MATGNTDEQPAKIEPRKIRHIRMSDSEWVGAAQKAEADGYTISEAVRLLLRDYRAGRIKL